MKKAQLNAMKGNIQSILNSIIDLPSSTTNNLFLQKQIQKAYFLVKGEMEEESLELLAMFEKLKVKDGVYDELAFYEVRGGAVKLLEKVVG